jgi:hypothetical protein
MAVSLKEHFFLHPRQEMAYYELGANAAEIISTDHGVLLLA